MMLHPALDKDSPDFLVCAADKGPELLPRTESPAAVIQRSGYARLSQHRGDIVLDEPGDSARKYAVLAPNTVVIVPVWYWIFREYYAEDGYQPPTGWDYPRRFHELLRALHEELLLDLQLIPALRRYRPYAGTD